MMPRGHVHTLSLVFCHSARLIIPFPFVATDMSTSLLEAEEQRTWIHLYN
jgi:hypothetical protein